MFWNHNGGSSNFGADQSVPDLSTGEVAVPGKLVLVKLATSDNVLSVLIKREYENHLLHIRSDPQELEDENPGSPGLDQCLIGLFF